MRGSMQSVLPAIAAADDRPAPRSLSVLLNRSATGYVLAMLLVIAAHATIALSWRKDAGSASFAVCIAAVAAAALFGGAGPGMLATILLALDLDYSFMPPYHSLQLDFQSLLHLMAFCTVAMGISSLQGRRHKAEESLRAARDELEARVVDRTAELLRSREQFRLLVNGFRDQAFFMLDHAGSVAGWNSGAERLLGYSEAEIVGRPLASIWSDAYRRDTTADLSRLSDSRSSDRFEHHDWIVRKDGSRFWGSIFLAHLESDPRHRGGQAVTIRDLTERRSLEREILDISERERIRIGHDLHDGLGQELSGTAMLSIALAQRLAGVDSVPAATAAAADAEQIADLIHESIRHTRELARGLCPLDMDEEGLPAAIRQLAERVDRLPGVRCECEVPRRVGVDSASTLHLHRIAQEAINNAVRHGNANLITVRLLEENRQLTLIVADDGVGIPNPLPRGSGLGLRLMRYRAKMIGASIEIARGSPCGTVVACRINTCGTAAPGRDSAGPEPSRSTVEGGCATPESGHG
jgi:PAS domain S-box-containing protein